MTQEALDKEAKEFGLDLIKDHSLRGTTNLSHTRYFKGNPVGEQVAINRIKQRNLLMYEKLFNADTLPTKIDQDKQLKEAGGYFGYENNWKNLVGLSSITQKSCVVSFQMKKNSILSYVFIYKV